MKINLMTTSLALLILTCLYTEAVQVKPFISPKIHEILTDLPSSKDLSIYLSSLERIINYCLEGDVNVDLNLSFGLFLLKVNLEPFVRHDVLPKHVRSHLIKLLRNNDYLLQSNGTYPNKKWPNDPDRKTTGKAKLISSLFDNAKNWSKRLRKFSLPVWKEIPSYNYPDLYAYLEAVVDRDKCVPSPQQSDTCLAELAKNNLSDFETPNSQCKMSEECYKILMGGSNDGYGLLHRMLLIQFARLGRGCVIFHPAIDERIRNYFCTIIYSEAEFIAINGYKIVDLIFEQIAVCTLDGHVEFVRKSWINNLLGFQQPSGCFHDNVSTSVDDYRKYILDDNAVNEKCNGHTTAVAAAALASATRYILEKYT